MKTKSRSVDPEKYLGNRSNIPDIYGSPGQEIFYSPFNLSLEAMYRLMLVDINDDPIYSTIELQMFDDRQGKGAAVLMYRRDGGIDTYHTSGLNRDVYQENQKGQTFLNDDMTFRFEVTSTGLNAYLSFHDKDSKLISFTIRENQPAKKTFDILAPAGAMIDDFKGFPFFYMKRTAFVERAGTSIHIETDGKKRKPEAIPVAINKAFVYLARYCIEPVVGTWNENFTGFLEPLKPGRADSSGQEYQLVENSGHYEIARVIRSDHGHAISLSFSPPIPDLACLKDGVTIEGRFTGQADDTNGIVAGKYSLDHSGNQTRLTMKPAKGWQPMPGRRWVKSYFWDAYIKKDNRGKIKIKSSWTRN